MNDTLYWEKPTCTYYYNIPLYIRSKHKYHNVKPKHILKELGVRQGTIFQTLRFFINAIDDEA